MLSESSETGNMESLITAYITHELVGKPKFGLKNDIPLFESGLLTSLALVKLVLFLEKQFHVVVRPEELLPKNFRTVNAICTYLRSKQGT